MKSFEEIARTFLKAVKSDLNVFTSVKQEINKNSETSYSLETPDHIQWAFAGRKAGKAPPLEAMLELVRSKNILFDGMDQRGTAFAIQQSIKHKGTKNYIPNAPDIMEKTVAKYQRQYETELGKFVSVDIDNQIKIEMEKMWKEESDLLGVFKI
tara:strand:- start:333 stop:794 length:462 start_codon:yes stop_codon:yes gene_type:complete